MKMRLFASLFLLGAMLSAVQVALAPASTLSEAAYPTNTLGITDMPALSGPSETVLVPNETPVNAIPSPIRITQFSYEKNSHQLLTVTIVVQDVANTTQHGFVWYILAPPDSAEPWTDAVYTATEQEITLQPGELLTLSFGGAPSTVIPGEYRLSVWAHRVTDTGERVHSDGMGAPDTVFVGSLFLFTIQSVALVPNGDATIVYVSISVRNNSAETARLAFSYSISVPDDLTPWKTGIFNLPFEDFELARSDSLVATYHSVASLNPNQQYKLTGWLHQIVAGTQTQIASTVYPSLIGRGTS